MIAEQNGSNVEVQQLEAQPVIFIRTTIQTADLPEAFGERVQALSSYLREHALQPAGRPFVRYHTFDDTETDFELGVPVAEPVVGEGRIAVGTLPGGPAITTWHIGPHTGLGEAYARIGAGMQEHGFEPGGPAREVYYWLDLSPDDGASSLPDADGGRTQLVQPIKE